MNNWSQSIIQAMSNSNGEQIIDLFKFAFQNGLNNCKLNFCNDQLVSSLIQESIRYFEDSNQAQNFEGFRKIFEKIIELTKEKDVWFLKVARYFSRLIKFLAIKADNLSKNKKSQANLESAVNSLRYLSGCISEMKSNPEKRKGILFVLNEIFWINFKMYNYHQCTALLNQMKNENLSEFRKSEQSTYYYYIGRLALFEGEMKKAYENLNISFRISSTYQGQNKIIIKKQILKYLIIARMYYGQMPKRKMLVEYNLLEYDKLCEGLIQGNIKIFDHEVELYKTLWIRRGIYFNLERIRSLLLRNLFKKVLYLNLQKNPDNFQLDTQYFVDAINFQSEEKLDIDEVECLIANLILKKYMKGYISHDKRKTVLSKKGAFPPLNEVINKQDL